MKNRIIAVVCVLLCSFAFVFADDNACSGSFKVTTDFAYYPLSSPVASQETHFAPLTGPYKGLEARVTGKYTYSIPVPFGDNPLVKGNTLDLSAALEVSPVSVMPKVSVAFTPVAFLVFSAGADAGTGWELIGIKGMGLYDNGPAKYYSIPAFSSWYINAWCQGLFQFDLAAVMPGDWNHVVMLAAYELKYTTLTGAAAGEPWIWQGTGEKVNGLNYNANIVLGYQMPLVLQMVGIQTEISGFFKDNYASIYSGYKGDFTKYSINPLAIFKFNDHHSLTVQTCFTARRGYSTEAETVDGRKESELNLNFSAYEWYFNRIAFSYTFSL